MKFDPFAWEEVPLGKDFEGPLGGLKVLASAPVALFISVQGFEALAGYGHSFDLTLAEPFSFRVEGTKGIRAFWEVPGTMDLLPSPDPSLTNAERLPHESGSMNEVRRALRLQKLESRAILREFREESARLRADRQAFLDELATDDTAVVDPGKDDTDEGGDGEAA